MTSVRRLAVIVRQQKNRHIQSDEMPPDLKQRPNLDRSITIQIFSVLLLCMVWYSLGSRHNIGLGILEMNNSFWT